jgi:hypothetical protein
LTFADARGPAARRKAWRQPPLGCILRRRSRLPGSRIVGRGESESVAMEDSKLKKLTIERFDFESAFSHAPDPMYASTQFAYLDRYTGEVIWGYEDDEDAEMEVGTPAKENRTVRQRIETAPERYLEIHALDHGDDHEILRAFLKSDWTDDDALWRQTKYAYRGSIGGWKRAVNDRDVIHAYYDFSNRRAAEMADEFLREHGIAPDWK